MFDHKPSPLERLELEIFKDHQIEVWIKRDDLLSPLPGNKGRKLKYHVRQMQRQGLQEFITFGGPFSNHLVAASCLCRVLGFKGIAIVRGEVDDSDNPVLQAVRANGMDVVGISRQEYAARSHEYFITSLTKRYPGAYIIPEGGAGKEGVEGCAEIVDEVLEVLNGPVDSWYVACGTGTTAAGIASRSDDRSLVVAVSALREKIVTPAVYHARALAGDGAIRFKLQTDYHFGGMAKWNTELIGFMNQFENETGILLDPIYTAKAMFALISQVRNDKIAVGSRIVFVHTGGAPGRLAFNYRFPGVMGAIST